MRNERFIQAACVSALSAGALLAYAAPAGAATLIRNDFATINVAYDGSIGTVNADGSPVVPAKLTGDRNTPPWVNPSGIEGNQSPDAGGVGLAGTYDDDNNSATPNVDVPGYLEVNGWDSTKLPGSLTISTSFPATGFDPLDTATLTFWAAARQGVTGGTVQIRDITTGTDLVAASPVSYASTATDWQFNSFSFAQDPTLAGHDLEVTFTPGTSQGDAGLELTDITLRTADVVPEPASLSLLGLGGLALLGHRRRQS